MEDWKEKFDKAVIKRNQIANNMLLEYKDYDFIPTYIEGLKEDVGNIIEQVEKEAREDERKKTLENALINYDMVANIGVPMYQHRQYILDLISELEKEK